MKSTIYLIPSLLDDEAVQTIPSYIIDAVKDCQVLFVENERTVRRYLKRIWREIVIDDYEWFTMGEKGNGVKTAFIQKLKEGKKIGIISEAGCPGVADPGQDLISIAHEMNVEVKPLVGPSSILLALMASGMNGQRFQFVGYLPINGPERVKAIKELEAESEKKNCTQIFIETPYRNNQLVESILKNCKLNTKLCVAVDLTGKDEWVGTMAIEEWKKKKPDIHKRPAIFLLMAE
jgi:16S rRNA (cytidine1402-2'-O)-methyltransferase